MYQNAIKDELELPSMLTARKRSLGQGNVLQVSVYPRRGDLCMMSLPVWLPGSFQGGLSPWSHVPSRGICPGVVSVQGGLCTGGSLYAS